MGVGVCDRRRNGKLSAVFGCETASTRTSSSCALSNANWLWVPSPATRLHELPEIRGIHAAEALDETQCGVVQFPTSVQYVGQLSLALCNSRRPQPTTSLFVTQQGAGELGTGSLLSALQRCSPVKSQHTGARSHHKPLPCAWPECRGNTPITSRPRCSVAT
jgi:hypothetical protein